MSITVGYYICSHEAIDLTKDEFQVVMTTIIDVLYDGYVNEVFEIKNQLCSTGEWNYDYNTSYVEICHLSEIYGEIEDYHFVPLPIVPRVKSRKGLRTYRSLTNRRKANLYYWTKERFTKMFSYLYFERETVFIPSEEPLKSKDLQEYFEEYLEYGFKLKCQNCKTDLSLFLKKYLQKKVAIRFYSTKNQRPNNNNFVCPNCEEDLHIDTISDNGNLVFSQLYIDTPHYLSKKQRNLFETLLESLLKVYVYTGSYWY